MCQKRIKRISLLGKKLFDLNIHAIIIPSSDPHQSEYLADHWKIREWFSGFTGSTGTLVITRHEAGLWTDSRYYLQAASELTESGIQLFKQGEPGIPDPIEYLCKNLESQSKIAINPNIWNHQSAKDARIKLEKAGHDLMTQYDPAEEIWNEEGRPSLPERKIFIHDLEYAGSSVSEKLQSVRKGMMSHDVDQHLITTLDDIAWLMNLRGHDIEFNPVFMSFVVVRKEDAILFIDREKLGQNVIHHLEAAGVLTKSYSDVSFYLQSVRSPILMNTDDCNDHLYHQVNFEYIVEGPTITRLLKACKTSSEIAHIDAVMVKDGIALAHVFFDLFQKLKGEGMTEAEFAASIAKSRSEQSGYYGESFPAIVGYQANGAIVHYRPKLGESARIRPEGLLLCDSGGQYVNGTTDITRTLAVGPVSEAQCDSYTRVLKGHIAIDQAEFPEGTTGGMLDILARQHLWKNGLNYGHGTGHGVGYFLNVHEGPQGISPGKGERSTTPLQPGMLTSNEPGYYEDGAYGIRIENLIVVEKSNHEGFLRHRHVTLFPIDTTPIKFQMMTRDEIGWINDYHRLVASKLTPHLNGEVADWIRRTCKII